MGNKMHNLTEDQARVIDSFLSEHWAAFESHCDERGENAKEICAALVIE